MKNLLFIASIAFSILTFIGIGLVLFGQVSGGQTLIFTLVPAVFAITCITTYRRKYRTK